MVNNNLQKAFDKLPVSIIKHVSTKFHKNQQGVQGVQALRKILVVKFKDSICGEL